MLHLSLPASSRILCSGFLPFRVRFNCVAAVLFQGTVGPFQKGPGSYRRWRAFHTEPPASVVTHAGGRIALSGGSSGRSWSVRQTSRWRSSGIYNHATPEKHATSRQKKLSSAKKLNACAASTSICISVPEWRRKTPYWAFCAIGAVFPRMIIAEIQDVCPRAALCSWNRAMM